MKQTNEPGGVCVGAGGRGGVQTGQAGTRVWSGGVGTSQMGVGKKVAGNRKRYRERKGMVTKGVFIVWQAGEGGVVERKQNQAW